MTQEKLAEASGLHWTAISMLERGRRVPSLSTLFALSGALGVKTWAMIREIESIAKEKPRRKTRSLK